MNGHSHHVGGHHLSNGNSMSVNNVSTQQQHHPHNPYQSVGYLPNHHFYQQNGGLIQGNNFGLQNNIGINQNVNLHNNVALGNKVQNNNFGFYNSLSMSDQQNQQSTNPQHQSLGGYHNQG